MKKKFTLIELIVVIAVLGILTAIVLPNISGMKEKTIRTAVIADTRVLQNVTDMYQMDNNSHLPSVSPPTDQLPQPVDFTKVYPEHLRNLPKTEGVKYWVDVNGTVWSSFEDMPQGFKYDASTGELSWNKAEHAKGYEIQEVVKSEATSSVKRSVVKYKPIKKILDSSSVTFKGMPNKAYAISSVDKYGFPSAPIGTGIGYESGYQDTLESIKKGQSGHNGNNPTNPTSPVFLENVTYSIVEVTGIVNVLGKTVPNADVKLTFPDGQIVSGKSNAIGDFSIPSAKSVDTDGKIGVVVTTNLGASKMIELNYVANKIANAAYTWERKQLASKAVYRAVPIIYTQLGSNPLKYPLKLPGAFVGDRMVNYETISEGTFEPFAPETTDTVYVAGSGENYSVSKQNFDSPIWNGMNVRDQVKHTKDIYNFTSSNTITTVLPKRLADIIYQSYKYKDGPYVSPFEEGELYLFTTYNSQFEYSSMDSHLFIKKLELINLISEQEEFKDVVVSKNKSAYPFDGIGKDGYHYIFKQSVDSSEYFETGGIPLDSFIRMNVRPNQIGTNTPITIDFKHPGTKGTLNAKYDNYEYKLDGKPIALSFYGTYRLQYPSLPAGEHVISTRVHQTNGGWSDWVNKTFVVQNKLMDKPEIFVSELQSSSKRIDGYDSYEFNHIVKFNVKNAKYVRILGEKDGNYSPGNEEYEFVSQYGISNPYSNGVDPDYGYSSKYTSDGTLIVNFYNVFKGRSYKAIAYDESGTITDTKSFYLDGTKGYTPKETSKVDVQLTYGKNNVTVKVSKSSSSVYPTMASASINEYYLKEDGSITEIIGNTDSSGSFYNVATGRIDLTKVITFPNLKPNTNYRIAIKSEYQDSKTFSKYRQYIYFKTN